MKWGKLDIEVTHETLGLIKYLKERFNLDESGVIEMGINLLAALDLVTSSIEKKLFEEYLRDGRDEPIATMAILGEYMYDKWIREIVEDLGFKYTPYIFDLEFNQSPYNAALYMYHKGDLKAHSIIYSEDYELSYLHLSYSIEGDIVDKIEEYMEGISENLESEISKRIGYTPVKYNINRHDFIGGDSSAEIEFEFVFEDRPNIYILDEIISKYLKL